jgi:hypothetical protein
MTFEIAIITSVAGLATFCYFQMRINSDRNTHLGITRYVVKNLLNRVEQLEKTKQ